MKNDMPLISIIVPIYKVEKYLNRCVESLVKQTYKNLEIILVDDGSPDNCPVLCDKWEEKDNRIITIHKDNGGLSDARNAGLKIANGEYIGFVDGDDWIEKDFIYFLYGTIKQTQSDVAGCCYHRGEQFSAMEENDYHTETFDRVSAMGALIDNRIEQIVWNKLYSRKIISGIPFEKGKYHEDEFWSYQIFARMERYAEITYVGYNYYVRADSIMGKEYSLRRLDAIEAKVKRQKFLESEMSCLKNKGAQDLLFTCMYHGQNIMKYLSAEDRKKAMNYLERVVSDIHIGVSEEGFLQTIWIKFAKRNLSLTCSIRNILQIGI